MNDFQPFLAPETLVDRQVYLLRSRNLYVGVWNAKTEGFIGIREKFNDKYLFTEYEYTLQRGTAHAVSVVDGLIVPDDIPMKEMLGLICTKHDGRFVVRTSPIPGPPEYAHMDDNTPCNDADNRVFWKSNDALFQVLKPLDDKLSAEQAEIIAAERILYGF